MFIRKVRIIMFFHSIFYADTRSVSDVSDFLLRYTDCDFLISPLHEDPTKKAHYHIIINITGSSLLYDVISYILGVTYLYKVSNVYSYLTYFLIDDSLNKNDIYLHGAKALKIYQDTFHEIPEDYQIL